MTQLFIVLAGGAGGSGDGFQFVFLGMMILVFWLFMIRPQAKRLRSKKNS